MRDPFLQDALDGFDAVPDNDHTQIIERLEKKFTQRAENPFRRKRWIIYGSVAASVLLIVGLNIYSFSDIYKNVKSNQEMAQLTEYEKNIPIADATPTSEQTPQTQTADAFETEMPIASLETSKTTSKKSLAAFEESNHSDVTAEKAPIFEEIYAFENIIVSTEIQEAEIIVEEKGTPMLETVSDGITLAEVEIQKQSKTIETYQKELPTARTIESAKPAPQFGEKEFQIYCQKEANKNICNQQTATVKISFNIDKKGKPTDIEFIEYTCEEAKNEVERLLSSSPLWTNTKRNVTMTVELE
jgi:hypothetical protein